MILKMRATFKEVDIKLIWVGGADIILDSIRKEFGVMYTKEQALRIVTEAQIFARWKKCRMEIHRCIIKVCLPHGMFPAIGALIHFIFLPQIDICRHRTHKPYQK